MPGRPLLSSVPLSEVIKKILREFPGGPMDKEAVVHIHHGILLSH